MVDVQCKVQTMLQPYLKHPLIQIEKEILLLEALVPPVSRTVYDSIVKCNDVEELFQALEQRHTARAKAVTGMVQSQHNEMSNSIRNVSDSVYYIFQSDLKNSKETFTDAAINASEIKRCICIECLSRT